MTIKGSSRCNSGDQSDAGLSERELFGLFQQQHTGGDSDEYNGSSVTESESRRANMDDNFPAMANSATHSLPLSAHLLLNNHFSHQDQGHHQPIENHHHPNNSLPLGTISNIHKNQQQQQQQESQQQSHHAPYCMCALCRGCSFCGKVFSTIGSRKRHERDKHVQAHALACDVCGKWCKNKGALIKHKSLLHRPRSDGLVTISSTSAAATSTVDNATMTAINASVNILSSESGEASARVRDTDGAVAEMVVDLMPAAFES